MKKMLFILGTILVLNTAHSSGYYGLQQTIDVNKLSSSITAQLNTSLSLTKDQEQQVLKSVSGFLTEKAKFISLSSSDKAAYQQKQAALFDSFKHKMSGILLMGQTNKFLALKPATNEPSNVLSNLFY